MAVSLISAMTILGFPVQVYYYGNVFGWIPIVNLSMAVLAAYYVIPLYYKLQLTTVYEVNNYAKIK